MTGCVRVTAAALDVLAAVTYGRVQRTRRPTPGRDRAAFRPWSSITRSLLSPGQRTTTPPLSHASLRSQRAPPATPGD